MNIREMLSPKGSNYIPVATSQNLGIAKFYDEHFDVVDGKVTIKQQYFKSLFEEYVANVKDVVIDTSGVKELKLTGKYADSEITYKLYTGDDEEISSASVTIPFSSYANKISVNTSENTVTINLLNDDSILSTGQFTLPTVTAPVDYYDSSDFLEDAGGVS